VCALIANTSPAIAKEAPFGTPGQVVITNGFAFVAEHLRSGGPYPTTQTSISIVPAADFFVLPGLNLGGHIGYEKSWMTSAGFMLTGDHARIGPSLGYAWNLNEHVSLWPNIVAGFGVSWSREQGDYLRPGARSTSVSYGGSLPLVVHVAPHFLIGFGPNAQHNAASWAGKSWRTTRLAANTFIGGWL